MMDVKDVTLYGFNWFQKTVFKKITVNEKVYLSIIYDNSAIIIE